MSEKRGRGRPPKLELITLEQAVEYIKNELRRKYGNEEIVRKMSITKKTLQNKLSANQIKRYGYSRCRLVDRNEIKNKLVS